MDQSSPAEGEVSHLAVSDLQAQTYKYFRNSTIRRILSVSQSPSMVMVARFLSAAMGDDDDADNVQGKWIGLGIVIGSAVLSNLGVNVQKLSHVRVRPSPLFMRI